MSKQPKRNTVYLDNGEFESLNSFLDNTLQDGEFIPINNEDINKKFNQLWFARNNSQQNIKSIIGATREENFVSPYIHTPEKIQIEDTEFVEDAPRKREPDKITSGILKGLSTPVLSSYEELKQAGDEFKEGKIGSGIFDALKGTLHTAITPITAPIGAISEGLKGTGEIGTEVAKGLEQTMQFPFDAIKYGSDAVNEAFKFAGIDISDSEWSGKANGLIQEVAGLWALGKTHRSIKSYIDKKIPEIKQIPKDPELVIKPQETSPVEGLTQEKTVTDLMPKIEPVVETPKVEETTSVKNEMMNKEREFRGLEPLETKEVRKQEPLIEDAKQKIESGEVDPNKLAQEIIDNPRILTDGDVAVLQVNARRLKNESTKIVDDISKETDPNKTQELRVKALELEEQYNVNDLASKQTGTDTARALAIRRAELKDNYSVAPLKQTARIANKNQPLPEEVAIKLESLGKRITEGDLKIKEYEERESRREAERVLQESIKQEKFQERTQKRETVKKDLDLEYQELIKEFAKTQQFNVLVDPKQISIMVKAAKNRINKGVTNIEQIVDQLYQDVKQYMPELTKKDIYDAIGGMGRFQKMTENDIKVELRDIRKQRSDESLQKSYKTRLENRKAELEKMLETGNFEKTPRRKTQITPELSNLKDEVALLKLKADREIQKIEQKNKPRGTKIYEHTIDIVSLFKSTVSGGEFSQVLRQGMIYALNPFHAKQVYGEGGAFREQFKYFKSERAYRDLQEQIKNDPNALLHKEMGVEFNSLNQNRVSKRNEFFQSRLTKYIPWIRPFERSFTGFLDKLKLDVTNDVITQYKKAGYTFKKDPELYKATGSWINNATGEGNFRTPELHRMFEQASPVLGLGLFSPRLIVSRLQMINPYYYSRLPKPVRIMAAKDMLGFIGAGISLLTIAKIAGADVELDPRSSDFMKVKVGATRLDPWGGMQQYFVLAARMKENETKSASGEIRSLNGETFPFKNRWDVARETLLENKLNPTWQAIKGFLTQKEWASDEPYGLDDATINLLVPLYYQDLIQATKEQGVEGLMLGMPAMFGVGMQTYEQKKPELKF